MKKMGRKTVPYYDLHISRFVKKYGSNFVQNFSSYTRIYTVLPPLLRNNYLNTQLFRTEFKKFDQSFVRLKLSEPVKVQ